jgi:hypothetical protein
MKAGVRRNVLTADDQLSNHVSTYLITKVCFHMFSYDMTMLQTLYFKSFVAWVTLGLALMNFTHRKDVLVVKCLLGRLPCVVCIALVAR